MKKYWWKVLTCTLLFYTVAMAFTGDVPALDILHETIRNLYFHVPMWFGMIVLLTVSLVYSTKYLGSNKIREDRVAVEAANVGVLYGILGLITGSLWAKNTWGAWWVNDAKLNGAAVTMLAYLAYFILRNSFPESQRKAQISAVYNIFAYVLMLVFILILPRLTDSLHPGNGGNPGFNTYDLDNRMRLVFYPAVAGWILLGVWLLELRVRIARLRDEDKETRA